MTCITYCIFVITLLQPRIMSLLSEPLHSSEQFVALQWTDRCTVVNRSVHYSATNHLPYRKQDDADCIIHDYRLRYLQINIHFPQPAIDRNTTNRTIMGENEKNSKKNEKSWEQNEKQPRWNEICLLFVPFMRKSMRDIYWTGVFLIIKTISKHLNKWYLWKCEWEHEKWF